MAKPVREHMTLLPLVNLLDQATKPDTARRGFTRGVVVKTSPLSIQLEGVIGEIDALIVGDAEPALGDCLVLEDGSGRRYFLGNVRSA